MSDFNIVVSECSECPFCNFSYDEAYCWIDSEKRPIPFETKQTDAKKQMYPDIKDWSCPTKWCLLRFYLKHNAEMEFSVVLKDES